MPIIYHDAVVGQLDAKKDGNDWRVLDLDIHGNLPVEALRRAVHRLAAIVEADRVTVATAVPSKWRKGLAGRVDPSLATLPRITAS